MSKDALSVIKIVLHSFNISIIFYSAFFFVKPGVFIDKDESEEKEKWTDRALMLEYGRINSIEAEENVKGGWIQRIRAR